MLAGILLVTACSGPLVIGTFYNGAAKRITKQLKSYASFNNAQKKAIDHRFAQYHQWHRSTQLPLYSDLLRKIATQLKPENEINPATVTQWVTQANDLSLSVRFCNPLNDSNDIWATLTEEQVAQIKQTTTDENTLRVKEYNSETASERLAKRHREMLTLAKRAGLKFNSKQSNLLRETLSQQISLGSQRFVLWKQWTDQFNNLLNIRNNSGFAESMNGHVRALWTLTQTTLPDDWQFNTELWTNFLYRFLSLQTAKQNQALYKKTTRIASTLDIISKKGASSVTAKCFDPLGQ